MGRIKLLTNTAIIGSISKAMSDRIETILEHTSKTDKTQVLRSPNLVIIMVEGTEAFSKWPDEDV